MTSHAQTKDIIDMRVEFYEYQGLAGELDIMLVGIVDGVKKETFYNHSNMFKHWNRRRAEKRIIRAFIREYKEEIYNAYAKR